MKKNYSIAELKKLLKKKSLSVMFEPYAALRQPTWRNPTKRRAGVVSGLYQATNLRKHDTKEWEDNWGGDFSGWSFDTEDTEIDQEIYPVEFVSNITIQQHISLKLTK